MEEILLDGVGAITQAQNKILVAKVRIILHDVPQHRPVANGHHWLGNIVSIFPQAHPKSAAKNDHFHLYYSFTCSEPDKLSFVLCAIDDFLGAALLMNLYLGNRNDELPAPLANKRVLLDDFVLQIPGKNQQKVRLRLPDAIWRKNRNMRPRQESAVLVRISVHGVIQEIRADRAVIQQSIALPRRSISRDLFPIAFRGNQKLQQLPLRFLHLLRKTRIPLQARGSGRFFSRTQLPDSLLHRFRWIFFMPSVDPQRSSMRWQFLNVEERDSMRCEDLLRRHKRKVGKMFVINRVELVFFHQPLQVRKLHGDHTRRLQQDFHPRHEVVQVRHLRENIIPEQQIRLFSRDRQLPGRISPKKLDQRRHTLLRRYSRNICRRFNPQHRHTLLGKVLQQISVVAGQFHHKTLFADSKPLCHPIGILLCSHQLSWSNLSKALPRRYYADVAVSNSSGFANGGCVSYNSKYFSGR